MITGVLRLTVARGKHPEEVIAQMNSASSAVTATEQILSCWPQRSQRTWLGRWRIEFAVGNSIPEWLWEATLSAYTHGLIDRAFFASSDGPGYRDVRDLRRHHRWWRFL